MTWSSTAADLDGLEVVPVRVRERERGDLDDSSSRSHCPVRDQVRRRCRRATTIVSPTGCAESLTWIVSSFVPGSLGDGRPTFGSPCATRRRAVRLDDDDGRRRARVDPHRHVRHVDGREERDLEGGRVRRDDVAAERLGRPRRVQLDRRRRRSRRSPSRSIVKWTASVRYSVPSSSMLVVPAGRGRRPCRSRRRGALSSAAWMLRRASSPTPVDHGRAEAAGRTCRVDVELLGVAAEHEPDLAGGLGVAARDLERLAAQALGQVRRRLEVREDVARRGQRRVLVAGRVRVHVDALGVLDRAVDRRLRLRREAGRRRCSAAAGLPGRR